MAVPKRRKSRSRRDSRRANWKLSALTLAECPECRQPKPPHRVCPHCGYYKDREILKAE